MGSAFALVLHTHLPMVLNHGRWPHGSDWLCEAAFECYLPLLETAHRLVADGISPKWTIKLSPILSEQLASPEFQKELSFYYENVRRACVESRAHFEAGGNKEIVRLTSFWEEFYERMWEMHRRIGGDIPGTFAELQRGGHVEMITCAATHGYLPLLGRDESIHLQLRTAVTSARRPAASGSRSARIGRATSGPRRPGATVAASGGSGPASRNCSPGTGSSTSWRTRTSYRPAIPSFSTATSCRSRRDATSPPRRCLGPRRARPTRRIGSRRAAAAGRRSRSSATRRPRSRSGAARTAIRGTTRTSSSTRSTSPAGCASGASRTTPATSAARSRTTLRSPRRKSASRPAISSSS